MFNPSVGVNPGTSVGDMTRREYRIISDWMHCRPNELCCEYWGRQSELAGGLTHLLCTCKTHGALVLHPFRRAPFEAVTGGGSR